MERETTRPLALAAAAAAAGTAKRSRSGRQRRRVVSAGEDVECGGWASLPIDMVHLVARRVLLAGDVVDYVAFRAACSGWRAFASPHRRDAFLTAPYLRPRGWVALCDGDAARPDDAREVAFFHVTTGRRLRARLPALAGHRIVGFTDGLLVLLHKRTTTVRVLHPFVTGAVIDFPPIAPTLRVLRVTRKSLLCMNAAVCTGTATATRGSIDVVAWFPGTTAVFFAKHGAATWDAVYLDAELQSALPFRGRLYATTRSSRNILQVYPPSQHSPVDTPIPVELGLPSSCDYSLVESEGRMLVAVQHRTNTTPYIAFKIFVVNLDRRQLAPVSGIGDRALFLGKDRCLSVSTMHLPSISGNSVYDCRSDVGWLHTLSSRPVEWPPASCSVHNYRERVRASVRPFTIADNLITYCNHLEWARGLMFHEYHRIPDCFEELKKKIKKQDSQLRIPFGQTRRKTRNPSAK